MPRVTKEQIARAKTVSVLDYLRTTQPQELVRVGQTSYSTRTHDSMRISENGLWNWYSRDFGGKTALKYMLDVEGRGYVEAVRELCDLAGGLPLVFEPVRNRQLPARAPARELLLPPRDSNAASALNYLRYRRIREPIIQYCYQNGLLYQTTSKGYPNCAFVAADEKGVPRHISLRGCRGTFRKEVPGSDKSYGFYIPSKDFDSRVLEIYEAPIDALSGASLRLLGGKSDWRSCSYLAMCGLSFLPIERHLRQHPEVNRIIVRLDNDEAGRNFARKIADRFGREGLQIECRFPKVGKDYNDQLRAYVEKYQGKER